MATSGTTVIEVKNLVKRYGNHTAVNGVSFTVEAGEIFGILGPNGAGKTTTVEAIVGLRMPDAGTIRVLGLDPHRDRAKLHQRVGVQLQEIGLPEQMKVWEALDLYSSFYNAPANWDQLLDELGLAQKHNTPFGKLSGGQRQRLSIVLALVGDPQIAVLDELTSGLDLQARHDTWRLIERIRDRGVTILLVTHLMDEAEHLCDRLALIHSGQVAAIDTPAGLISHAAVQQRVRFHTLAPLDERILTGLPEILGVSRRGSSVIVTGRGDLLQVVASALAQHQITANDLRIEPASLDDAFIALTGR